MPQSKSYVVALERSRLRGDGPTPTIDVVARLASALGLSPTDLFHGGLRRTSTHVLLVVDDLRRATMPSVLRAAPEGTERWLLVGSNTSHAAGAHHTFDLERGRRHAYEPARIEQSLRRQLGQIGDDLHQRGIGFVFDETSTAIQKFHAHDAVVAFEHSWADVVDGATTARDLFTMTRLDPIMGGLVLGTLGALRNGSRLVHTGKPTPDSYASAAVRGGSLYFGVPTVWGRVCQEPDAARMLSSARLLVSGSAPLPVPVFEQMAMLTGQSPVERYGMTETLITVSTRFDGERRPGWVGLPIDGVSTRLVDDDGQPVPHDGITIGELQLAGATLYDGYLNRPDATAASFDGAWFRTGDAAVIDRSGFHRIVGRQSMDIIKTGGFKVGAGEVETVLLGHPAVREAAVVGVADPDLGQRIVAYVVAENVEPGVLIEHVAAQLSVHKRPREVRVVAELPRNAMGKVQKHLLTTP